jgi:HSP20 family molecular chaperone IbpA
MEDFQMAERKEHAVTDNLEAWFEQLFKDPYTSYLDCTEFQVDLFETQHSIIVEAWLKELEVDEIEILRENSILFIHLYNHEKNCKRSRQIEFPFTLTNRVLSTKLEQSILEISISKASSSSPHPAIYRLQRKK